MLHNSMLILNNKEYQNIRNNFYNIIDLVTNIRMQIVRMRN